MPVNFEFLRDGELSLERNAGNANAGGCSRGVRLDGAVVPSF